MCAQNNRPDSVSRRLQIERHGVKPSEVNSRANLFAKDCDRTTLNDETPPFRPEVAGVVVGLSKPRSREGLTRATACPNRSVSPAGELEGVGPAPDPREEVALRELLDILGLNLLNRPAIDDASGEQLFANQIL